MKLQNNRKSSDHIHNTLCSKMKLLQPSRIYIENIKYPAQKPRDQNISLQWRNKDFAVR